MHTIAKSLYKVHIHTDLASYPGRTAPRGEARAGVGPSTWPRGRRSVTSWCPDVMRARAQELRLVTLGQKLGPEVFSFWNVETNEIATLSIWALRKGNVSELCTVVVQAF